MSRPLSSLPVPFTFPGRGKRITFHNGREAKPGALTGDDRRVSCFEEGEASLRRRRRRLWKHRNTERKEERKKERRKKRGRKGKHGHHHQTNRQKARHTRRRRRSAHTFARSSSLFSILFFTITNMSYLN